MRQDHRWRSGERVRSESRSIRRTMVVAFSTQNAEQWKDYRSKEVSVYSGYDKIDHSMEEMNKLINEKVIRASSLHASSSLVKFR